MKPTDVHQVALDHLHEFNRAAAERRAKAAHVADQALAALRELPAVEALAAISDLTTRLPLDREHYVGAALEQGADWDQIGQALQVTSHSAYAWYRNRVRRAASH